MKELKKFWLDDNFDASFGDDTISRKITTGCVIMYCGGAVAWVSQRQPIVTLSSTESEIIAAAECTKASLLNPNLVYELTVFHMIFYYVS